jgi:hypothetical protein
MAGDNRLTLFSVDVDTSTGKASMREFVRESERAGRESEAAFKRGASAGMSESERAAFLKPIDDLHKELLGRIRGLGSATSSMEREAVSASAGVARGFAGIATAAGFAAAGVGLVAFGLDQFADAAALQARIGLQCAVGVIEFRNERLAGAARIDQAHKRPPRSRRQIAGRTDDGGVRCCA